MKWTVVIYFAFFFNVAHADYLIFSDNGKMGIKDETGQVVIPPSFDALGWSDGSFSVIGNVTGYRLNNHWGIITLKNEFLTSADYESLVYAGADNIIARKKINPAQVKAGCIDLKGVVKIPFQYEGISIHGLRAIVFNLDHAKYVYGLTDLQNRVLIPVRYKNIYPLGTLRYAVENEAGKIALHGEDGKPITDFLIDSISSFRDSKAIIYENLKQGLIDREGSIKLMSIYRSIEIQGDNKVKALPPHEWFFISDKNEIISRFQADELMAVNEKLFIVQTSGKYGLIDNQLNYRCAAQYDLLTPIDEDVYLARLSRKMGTIKSDNSIAIPFIYDSLYGDKDIIRAFRKIEGWSLIDMNNQTLTEKNYDWIGPRQNNFFPVINNRYWGALDTTGEEIVHCVFDSLVQITENLLVVKFKNQYGIIDSNEKWIVAPQTNPMRVINDHLYLQRQGTNTFIRNFAGEIIYFTDNRLEFKKDFFVEYLKDGTEKTIDYQGRTMTRTAPPTVDNVELIFPSSEGFRGVKRDGKYGFIDERGRLRIANRYDGIGEFHEGLSAFKLIGKWGFINSSDQVVINPNFEKVSHFENGLAIVQRSGKTGIIDKKGNPIISFQYDSIRHLPNKKYLLYASGRSGLADEKGIILIDSRFEYLSMMENDLVLVGNDGKFGVLTLSGLNVIPIIYEKLSYDKNHRQFLALKKSEWKEIEVK